LRSPQKWGERWAEKSAGCFGSDPGDETGAILRGSFLHSGCNYYSGMDGFLSGHLFSFLKKVAIFWPSFEI
jgi:hypothetical protein